MKIDTEKRMATMLAEIIDPAAFLARDEELPRESDAYYKNRRSLAREYAVDAVLTIERELAEDMERALEEVLSESAESTRTGKPE